MFVRLAGEHSLDPILALRDGLDEGRRFSADFSHLFRDWIAGAAKRKERVCTRTDKDTHHVRGASWSWYG